MVLNSHLLVFLMISLAELHEGNFPKFFALSVDDFYIQQIVVAVLHMFSLDYQRTSPKRLCENKILFMRLIRAVHHDSSILLGHTICCSIAVFTACSTDQPIKVIFKRK